MHVNNNNKREAVLWRLGGTNISWKEWGPSGVYVSPWSAVNPTFFMFFRKRRIMFYKYYFEDKDDCAIYVYIEFFIWSDSPFEIILHRMYHIYTDRDLRKNNDIYAYSDTDMQRDCISVKMSFKLCSLYHPHYLWSRRDSSCLKVWSDSFKDSQWDISANSWFRMTLCIQTSNLKITHINCNWSVESHVHCPMFYLFCSGHIIGIVCMHYIFGNVLTGRSTSNVSENVDFRFPDVHAHNPDNVMTNISECVLHYFYV